MRKGEANHRETWAIGIIFVPHSGYEVSYLTMVSTQKLSVLLLSFLTSLVLGSGLVSAFTPSLGCYYTRARLFGVQRELIWDENPFTDTWTESNAAFSRFP